MKLTRPVPLHKSWIEKEEEAEVLETLRSGWLTRGPRTQAFERSFADYVGCRHAIGVNSGTAALHLALASLGIGEGDEVVTTPITFAATGNVIVLQRAHPVFADVEADTLNIDPAEVAARITAKTRAILPVHLFGHPCEMDAIMALARARQLAVIEDAAHAIEARYRGRPIGAIGDLTAFSFYATKNITTGEGGMVTTNDDGLAERLRLLRLHGVVGNAGATSAKAPWDVVLAGYNYTMSDIQAALGLHQLEKIDGYWDRRRRLAAAYDDALKHVEEVRRVGVREGVRHAYHLYPILLRTEDLTVDRDAVVEALREAGVGAGVHFRALHLMSFYRERFGFAPGDFPNAEYAADRLISLPLYPKMEEEDVEGVVEALMEVVRRLRKRKGR
jgi:dTDP-4-amino-4,6-dideoxygalactose transaminase